MASSADWGSRILSPWRLLFVVFEVALARRFEDHRTSNIFAIVVRRRLGIFVCC